MKNKRYIFLFKICFNIIILLSLINITNSLSFFPLENVKEEEISPNNTFLYFKIKGAIDSAINENITFKIETVLYKDNELLAQKKYAECLILRYPNAVFGTQIYTKCKLDLFYNPLTNKIFFSKFISNLNIIKIDDPNKYVIGKNLTFYKNIDIKPNFEFILEDLKAIKCFNKKFIFGLIGEVDKIFISSFIFNLTINSNSSIIAKCESPYIYFTRKIIINCTINILNNDTDFIINLNKGIQIKPNYYRVINDEGEKIIKIKINNKIFQKNQLKSQNE